MRTLLIVFVAFGAFGHAVTASAQSAADTVPVELSTIGLDGRTGTPIVVLRDPESGGVLPVWIGPMEAQAIALSLHGVVPPRPMTHDLMASLIANLRAEVEEVLGHLRARAGGVGRVIFFCVSPHARSPASPFHTTLPQGPSRLSQFPRNP